MHGKYGGLSVLIDEIFSKATNVVFQHFINSYSLY